MYYLAAKLIDYMLNLIKTKRNINLCRKVISANKTTAKHKKFNCMTMYDFCFKCVFFNENIISSHESITYKTQLIL